MDSKWSVSFRPAVGSPSTVRCAVAGPNFTRRSVISQIEFTQPGNFAVIETKTLLLAYNVFFLHSTSILPATKAKIAVNLQLLLSPRYHLLYYQLSALLLERKTDRLKKKEMAFINYDVNQQFIHSDTVMREQCMPAIIYRFSTSLQLPECDNGERCIIIAFVMLFLGTVLVR